MHTHSTLFYHTKLQKDFLISTKLKILPVSTKINPNIWPVLPEYTKGSGSYIITLRLFYIPSSLRSQQLNLEDYLMQIVLFLSLFKKKHSLKVENN